jgi:hypothetical protein
MDEHPPESENMNETSRQTAQPHFQTLYSYIVTHDTGFAPNPFFGYCTLACCKPMIRRNAKIGDWIVGLSPKKYGNRLVYFMRVDEILSSFDLYWRDTRFANKKPRYDSTIELQRGDNIYQPIGGGEYRQHRSFHSIQHSEEENPSLKAHDLSGKRILVSENYAYFGATGQQLPASLNCLIVARGHKCRFPDEVKEEFLCFVGSIGLLGLFSNPRQMINVKSSCINTSTVDCGCF